MPVYLESLTLGIIDFSRLIFLSFFDLSKRNIMKKLANTSPFLLLLLPLFLMIILTLTVNTNQNNGEIVIKPAKTNTSIVKQATAIFQ